MNKALTEYTPKAYLTGEARLARRIDIENNHNTCATHTAGESGFAPTNYDYQYFIPICVGFYSFAGVAGNAPSESETKEKGGDLVKS